ncbi:hypothetical protein Ddc_01383 [Ditylenchus destructor]|nr:hypothetical protein Ddc_01383 [Ditylenchus destructor]
MTLSFDMGPNNLLSKAKALKCDLCNNVVANPEKWENKAKGSRIGQLKHCVELANEHDENTIGGTHKQAFMFACHAFTKELAVDDILSAVKAQGSSNPEVVCHKYCKNNQ